MIHAEVSIYPMGTSSTSASFYIARALEAISSVEGLRHQLTPMGTLLESDDISKVLEAARTMSDAVHNLGVARVEMVIKIDSRKDRQTSLEEKIESVKRHLKTF